ncbi:hypothetical protein HaLaN_01737, partial [Haematococcus lacustris]
MPCYCLVLYLSLAQCVTYKLARLLRSWQWCSKCAYTDQGGVHLP